MWKPVALFAALVVVTGCGSSSTSTPSSEPTPTATPAASASTPTPDIHAACALLLDGDGEDSLVLRVPKSINALQAQATEDQVDEMLAVHRDLEAAADHAPTDLATAIRTLGKPFSEFNDSAATGGGKITLDTSSVETNLAEVMRLCAESGYKVDHDTDSQP